MPVTIPDTRNIVMNIPNKTPVFLELIYQWGRQTINKLSVVREN